MTAKVFISPERAQELIASESPVHVLDVRWALGRDDGLERYEQAHLPGAVYVDLEASLAAPNLPATAGRHPLPDEEEFTKSMQLWGLNPDETVIVYDDVNSLSAARAWWLLKHAGHEQTYILDGGFQAWQKLGGLVQAGAVIPQHGTAEAKFGHMPVTELDEVEQTPLLLDARAPERFSGKTEPVDPRAGHIPGALNLPAASLVQDERAAPPEYLEQQLKDLGFGSDDRTAVYCGSGVTASYVIAVAAQAGHKLSLYPGSFSQWSNLPDLPVQTDDTP